MRCSLPEKDREICESTIYFQAVWIQQSALQLYLYDEHDDCEVSLMGRTKQFQSQVYYSHIVALNKVIISLLALSHLLQLQ